MKLTIEGVARRLALIVLWRLVASSLLRLLLLLLLLCWHHMTRHWHHLHTYERQSNHKT